jgi:hypothetical protein
MNTIETGPSNNARDSEVWSRCWTHFRVDRRSPRYCLVTFDHPPINTITATTVAELSDLAGLIEQDPDLNVVVFDSANRDFYLAHYDLENDPGRTEALGVGPLDCRPGSTSLSVWLVPRWSASPRSGGAPAAPGASSFSPVICGSPLARTRFSAVGTWRRGGSRGRSDG